MKSDHRVSEDLYLDLLKRTLTGSLFEENDLVLGVSTRGVPGWKNRIANSLAPVLSSWGLEVIYKRPYDPDLRAGGETTRHEESQ